MTDLNHYVYMCDVSPMFMEKCGWLRAGIRRQFRELVTGVLHVDDLVAFSRIFCMDCLRDLILSTFPRDVGFQEEERGPTMRDLSSIVHIRPDSSLVVVPMIANVTFGIQQDHQVLVKLGPYHDATLQPYKSFRDYLIGQFLSFNHLVQGQVEYMFVITVAVVAEPYWLGWPSTYIWKSMRSIPRRHQSPFIIAVRRLSRAVKLGLWSQLFDCVDRLFTNTPELNRIFTAMSGKTYQQGKFWKPKGPHGNGGGHGAPWPGQQNSSNPNWAMRALHDVRAENDQLRAEKEERDKEKQRDEIVQATMQGVQQAFGVSSGAAGSSHDSAKKSSTERQSRFPFMKAWSRLLRPRDSDESRQEAKGRRRSRDRGRSP